MGTRKPFARGFTLVEILVVILVLAVIAAILYPVLTTGRVKSNESVCISQLRQIGKAFEMYQEDYGYRPLRLHNLWPVYVSDKRLFVCPNDAWTARGGWAWSAWGKHNTPPEKWPFPISYGYFFANHIHDADWELAQAQPGRPGYVVCVLHGEQTDHRLEPDEAPYFQGRTLRLCFDGSVIARDIRYKSGAFNSWKLRTDQDKHPHQP